MNRMSLPPKYSCLLIGIMGVLLGAVEWLFEPDGSTLDSLRSPQEQQILQNLSGPLAVVIFMASVLRRQIIYALGHNILDDTVCMSLPYWLIGHLSRLRPLHRTGVFLLVTLSLQGGMGLLAVGVWQCPPVWHRMAGNPVRDHRLSHIRKAQAAHDRVLRHGVQCDHIWL